MSIVSHSADNATPWRRFAGIGAAAAVLIGTAAWVRNEDARSVAPQTRREIAAAAYPEAAASSAPPPGDGFIPLNADEDLTVVDAARPPALELVAGTLPWEMRARAILTSATSDAVKARELLDETRRAPAEAFELLTQEAAAHLSDADFTQVALPLLLKPGLHGAIQSVLFADLMKRPDVVVLPALLTIARTPRHPYRESARDALGLLLGVDYANNWSRWEGAVQHSLAHGR